MTTDRYGDALLPAGENRRMFDAIAARYDRLNHLLSLGLDRRWRRRAVQALQLGNQAVVLDAGCGTGDLCVDVLSTSESHEAVGIDPSEKMLALAREKLAQHALAGRATFIREDVTALSFEDARFDGVISAFCIRNVCDRKAAFHEIRRVLKPGCRVAILELTRPANAFLRAGHCFFIRAVVPVVGALLSRGEAYRYLADSIEQFVDPQTLLTEMKEAGLQDVQATALTGGVVTLFCGKI